jgi:hypothetical protein
MPIQGEAMTDTQMFLDRVVDGALDTIEVTQLANGKPSFGLDSPHARRVAIYIAYGALAQVVSLAEQADASEELGEVMEKIARMWSEDADRD